MGSWWGKPADDTPDDVTGLTANQIQLIRDTWKIIDKNKRDNGFVIFRTLFKEHPDTKKLFRSMEDVDLDVPGEFERNVAARAHMVRFMHSFATFIDTLHEPADLRQILYDLGKTHAKHGVQEEIFDALGPVLLKALHAALGGKFTSQVEAAWLAAYTFFCPHLKEGLIEGQRLLAD